MVVEAKIILVRLIPNYLDEADIYYENQVI